MKNCVLAEASVDNENANSDSINFTIKNKIVVTLSVKDSQKLLKHS